MSFDLIRTSTPIAKKSYHCMASDWIRNGDLPVDELSFAERRAIVKARRNKWRIAPGERYINQIGVCCGDFVVFRAIPAIHDICCRLDIYEDAC